MPGKRGSSSGPKKDKSVVGQVKQFAKDSQTFLDKCNKPSREGKKYQQLFKFSNQEHNHRFFDFC